MFGIKPGMQALRAQLETRGLSAPRLEVWSRLPDLAASGIPALDQTIGGVPRGRITEILGPLSSGKTRAMLRMLAEATRRQEICALVDATDAFDPVSASQAGVQLPRLLWVRCKHVDHALQATDLILQSGGFGMVALDLTGLSPAAIRPISSTSWIRFQRCIEKTPTVLTVFGREATVRTCAWMAIRMEALQVDWANTISGPAPAHTSLLRNISFKHALIRSRPVPQTRSS